MITRVVDVKTKPGKAKELCRKLHEDVLGILKSHPGFIDEIVLIADHDADQVLAMSFWKTKADAEDFHHREFKHINEMIQHLSHTAAKVHIYDVETSTVHHVAKGKPMETGVSF
ncbi:MAG: antibiotic biosynthesis monooxygenase family protein [Terriglobales bacterium]